MGYDNFARPKPQSQLQNPLYTPRNEGHRNAGDSEFNSAGIDSMLRDHTSSMTDVIGDMGRGGQTTDPADAMRRAGYTVKGKQAVKYVKGMNGRGIPVYAPVGQATSTAPRVDPQLAGALESDIGVQNALATDQWQRVNNEREQYEDFLGTIDDRMLGQADDLFGGLMGQADRFNRLGQEHMDATLEAQRPVGEGIERSFDQTMQGLDKANQDIDEGYKIADQAAAYAEQVRRGYVDTGAMEASAAASGIARSFKEQEKMIVGGLRPDGTKMTMGEQMQAHAELNLQSKMAIQEQVTPILARFNEVDAQLGQMVAQMKMTSGQLRIQGAAERKGIAMSGMEAGLGAANAQSRLVDQQLQAMEGQRQMAQLSSTMHQMGAQIEQSAMFKAAEMIMQGMEKTAEFVMQNPRSVVSYFQGLLGLLSTEAAMGGGGGEVKGGRQNRPTPPAQTQAPAQAKAKEPVQKRPNPNAYRGSKREARNIDLMGDVSVAEGQYQKRKAAWEKENVGNYVSKEGENRG
jgi:hypothetical protein